MNIYFFSLGSGDAAALAIAQQILGTGAHIKRGNNTSSVFSGVIGSSGGVGMASAINVNYTDGGLFGYFVISDSANAGQVSKAVHT